MNLLDIVSLILGICSAVICVFFIWYIVLESMCEDNE
jgi:hypothetical protein